METKVECLILNGACGEKKGGFGDPEIVCKVV